MPLTATIPVTVSAPGSILTPWRSNDFSRYTAIGTTTTLGNGQVVGGPTPGAGSLFADRYATATPNGWFSNYQEDTVANQMSLVTGAVDGPPGGSSQYLRYTQPAMPNNCGDYTIRINVGFPPQAEIYFEFYIRFSSNFRTKNTNMNCTGPGGVIGTAQKFLMGRINARSGIPATRFTWAVGTNGGNQCELGFEGNTYSTLNSTAVNCNTQLFDGQWHRARGRYRVDPTSTPVAQGGSTVGTGHQVYYLDNAALRIGNNQALLAQNIYGIMLNANLNQGPVNQQTCDFGLLNIWLTNPGWTETGF